MFPIGRSLRCRKRLKRVVCVWWANCSMTLSHCKSMSATAFPTFFLTRGSPFIRNPHTFRIWCPDELVSNKFEATLRDSGRNFQWDVASRNQGGRVIEVLSEHLCQGMLQGYTLTGRTGLFPSYESFMGIIHTMVSTFMIIRRS